jgi:hypothetical protein
MVAIVTNRTLVATVLRFDLDKSSVNFGRAVGATLGGERVRVVKTGGLR